jgi:hypothetical protein
MIVAVGGDAFADDDAGIVNRPRDLKNAEVARGKIAKRVESQHLAIREKEAVLGVVGRGLRTDDHAGGIASLIGNAVGRARISAKGT